MANKDQWKLFSLVFNSFQRSIVCSRCPATPTAVHRQPPVSSFPRRPETLNVVVLLPQPCNQPQWASTTMRVQAHRYPQLARTTATGFHQLSQSPAPIDRTSPVLPPQTVPQLPALHACVAAFLQETSVAFRRPAHPARAARTALQSAPAQKADQHETSANHHALHPSRAHTSAEPKVLRHTDPPGDVSPRLMQRCT